MSIAPIVRTVSVAVPPPRAFALFTGHIGRWWSPQLHIGAEPIAEVVIEPRVGGRWFERGEQGGECDWGEVLAWEPPHRVLLAWRIGSDFRFDPALETQVEVRFEAEDAGTRVILTHRHLERLGARAGETRAQLDSGWPGLVQRFADLVEQETRHG